MSSITVTADPAAVRAWSTRAHQDGHRVVLVPTMGYLHEGHLSLVREARRRTEKVIVSVFVNPTQFAPNEDLDTYPRDLDGDIRKLEELGVDMVFTPTPQTVYPSDFNTYVVPNELATTLCGASRPTFFRGVCTVVVVLFRITGCDIAVFGQKDYQQYQIIRRMSRDLWLDVEVVGMPIVREADGLAMSSRNAYLSDVERHEALSLSRALNHIEEQFRGGLHNCRDLLNAGRRIIEQGTSGTIDYLQIVDAHNLQTIEEITTDALCALAVVVGKTRLIDNRVLRMSV